MGRGGEINMTNQYDIISIWRRGWCGGYVGWVYIYICMCTIVFLLQRIWLRRIEEESLKILEDSQWETHAALGMATAMLKCVAMKQLATQCL